jgi:hypothetical protein
LVYIISETKLFGKAKSQAFINILCTMWRLEARAGQLAYHALNKHMLELPKP